MDRDLTALHVWKREASANIMMKTSGSELWSSLSFRLLTSRTHVEQLDEMRARLDHFGILINGLVDVVSRNFMGNNTAGVPTTPLRPAEAGPGQDTLLQSALPQWPSSASPYDRDHAPGLLTRNEESGDPRDLWSSSSTSVRMTAFNHDNEQLQVRFECDARAESGRGSRTAQELSYATVQHRYGCTRNPSHLKTRIQVDPTLCLAIGSIGHRICQKYRASLESFTIVHFTSSTPTMGPGDSRWICQHSWGISTSATWCVRLVKVDRPSAPPITRRFYIVACCTWDPSSCAESILH